MNGTLRAFQGSLFSLSLLAAPVFAHPGHDHGHWSSPALHALLIGGVIAVAVVAIWRLLRTRQGSRVRIRRDD